MDRELPLQGLRVLDFTRVWAGPLCVTTLADMGADVIRIEPSDRSMALSLRPEYVDGDPMGLRCSNFVRNRRCIAMDLGRPEALAVARDLVRISDIIVENFTPHVMHKFGLDYEHVRHLNPTAIMISLSACGQTGPWRDRLTYGPTLAGLYGLAGLLGYPGDPWPRADVSEADPIGGGYGIVAVMAALFHRDRTGSGQYIDLAQGEGLLHMAPEAVLEYTLNGRVQETQGNLHATLAPHGMYPCTGNDEWIAISVENEAQWRHLSHVLGDPPWTSDPRFQDIYRRIQAREALDQALAKETVRFERYQLTSQLQAGGVAAYPVLTAVDQLADPHLRDRRRRTVVDIVPAPEEVPLGIPWSLSDTPGTIRRPTGIVGADAREILSGVLGKGEDEVRRLFESGAVLEPRIPNEAERRLV